MVASQCLERDFGDSDTPKATSNTVFSGDSNGDLTTEAEGYVHQGNKVVVTFIPRMSHIGISLEGEIDGDTVKGTWVKRDYAPRYTGTFTMSRWENGSSSARESR